MFKNIDQVMSEEQKSSCCGAETYIHKDYVEGAHAFMETGEMCPVCQEYCDTIPSDLWCKKEILEFCEKWDELLFCPPFKTGGLIEYASKIPKFQDDLQQFLKSVKEQMK